MIRWRSLGKLNIPNSWTLLPLRLIVGVGFLLHGLEKLNRGPAKFAAILEQIGAPYPLPTAWLVACIEVLGGMLLIIGLMVRLASIPLIISMLVALFTVHIHYGFSSVNTIGLTPSGPVFGPPGYEINLLYIAGLIALALSSPTAASVDRILFREKSNLCATENQFQGGSDEPARAI
ncbi:MAG TPA: DoxX family protein [Pirellulales bacterium]|jgi:putative oxidoreductase|nr:DoxX family protein [Pirellulales bacterium]